GFRDFLPKEAKKRQYVIDKIRGVFESYGFEPLETPALEYAEVLKGKYGEEEKLIYDFKTRGGDEVALRYDQTVPLARVVAQYGSTSSPQGQPLLPTPFKRYQIQNVWRGENPQKGRFREFLQCDADIVGTSSLVADAEIIALVFAIYEALGLEVTIKINDRKNLENLDKKIISAIDKLGKIGESAVLSEMIEKGVSNSEAKEILSTLSNKPQTDDIKMIFEFLKEMSLDISKVRYEPTLARGLDYYTGIIFETVIDDSVNSLCSGGRYDNLIGTFAGRDIPAVGFGLGFDRTIEVLEEKNLLADLESTAKVLVTVFSMELGEESIKVANELRNKGINTELWLDAESKLDKQLKYASLKNIPYVVIIGPEEAKNGTVTLRDMKTGDQKPATLEKLIKDFS
ncbi:MAG: histidine--tRNA ligase, partial [Candidatus Levyibacteriota bacterium]